MHPAPPCMRSTSCNLANFQSSQTSQGIPYDSNTFGSSFTISVSIWLPISVVRRRANCMRRRSRLCRYACAYRYMMYFILNIFLCCDDDQVVGVAFALVFLYLYRNHAVKMVYMSVIASIAISLGIALLSFASGVYQAGGPWSYESLPILC